MTWWMDAGNRRNEDSGLIDLDALMRQANASPAVSKSQPPVKKASPLPAPAEPLESTPALVAPIPPTPASMTPSRQTKGSRPFVAFGIALALSAAGLYGYVRGTAPTATTRVVAVTPREASLPTLAPAVEPAREEAPSTKASNANDLPSVASAQPPVAPSVVVAKHGAPAKQAEAVVATTELLPESPAQPNDLGRAMHEAVGDQSSRVAKVEGPQGGNARSVRPSPGAVIGALNAVLPSARECLGPDDAIRVGTVTFRSDGTVAKVELNGKRASDDCIKGAVTRARVEPFADDTFTTRVTVRP
jgi:hypothetical protein